MDQESNFSLKKKNLILLSSIVGLVLCTINMIFGFRLLNPIGRSYDSFNNNWYYYNFWNEYVSIPITAITASILGIFSNIFGVICAIKFPNKCLIILCVISSVWSSFANLAQLIVVISTTASSFAVPCTILSTPSPFGNDNPQYKCPGNFLLKESAVTSNLVFICMVFLLASLELGKSITMAILGCKQSCQMSNNMEIMRNRNQFQYSQFGAETHQYGRTAQDRHIVGNTIPLAPNAQQAYHPTGQNNVAHVHAPQAVRPTVPQQQASQCLNKAYPAVSQASYQPNRGVHQGHILGGQPQLHAVASQPSPNYVQMAQHQATAALPAPSQMQASRITAEPNKGSNASQAPSFKPEDINNEK